ncbi:MAG: acyltransferase [Burkholderiales bacterium]|nr:acyltransferase [Burkholderiales bacterium]
MSATGAGAGAPRQVGLDLIRALAIILTCAMHFVWAIGAWQFGRDFEMLPIRAARGAGEAFWLWAYHSQHGVYLFFVLSGFLLTQRWFTPPAPQVLRYLRDRAWRTLPGAWLALACALLLLALAGKAPADPWLRWLENALFLDWFRRDDSHHLLIVTWSLQAEWLFYLALPVVAWLAAQGVQRALPAWCAVALCGVIAVAVLKLTSQRGGAYALFFAAGALCAVQRDAWRTTLQRVPWWALLAVYVGVNLVYGWTTPTAARLQSPGFGPFEWHAVAFAAIAAAMVLKAANEAFRDALWVRLGSHIGRISFSIYLWHLLVVIALAQLFDVPGRWSNLPAPGAIALYLCVLTAVTWAVSVASFALIERPYFQRRQRQR